MRLHGCERRAEGVRRGDARIPAPFRGSKALHACLNRGINEVLGVPHDADIVQIEEEAEDDIDAAEHFGQRRLVRVVNLHPSDAVRVDGRAEDWLVVAVSGGRVAARRGPNGTFRVKTVTSCFFLASILSMTSRATSAMGHT